ncbi:MAG: hypothetical protein COX19_04455 [Desulfobacterales bacterium CG23_combo_of_CG06-09_8_20_14_all_51_8]|nr:MAG: hypothetical protein COX19_04455 [Desulfobacterales bacterium CG23_combo_of_CG06-09_8_20_14_all_51_8]
MSLTVGTNSYVTEAEADAYFFETRVNNDAWDTDSDRNEAALLNACRLLEYGIRWHYEKTSTTQAMQWPRTGFDDFDTDEIPEAVEIAQFELALDLKKRDATNLIRSAGFDYVKLENLTFSVDNKQTESLIPDHVFLFISDLGQRKGDGTGTVKRMR